jgi:prepilin-type N-terminal cleavage/methylation domain-containing protein
MFFKRLHSRLSQAGFTLIEVMVALAICGVLGGGVITAIYQIGTTNSIDNARIMAVNQVENAVFRINRDMQMAQKIEYTTVSGVFTLKLAWTTWDNNQSILVQYIWSPSAKTLSRSYSLNGGSATTTLIGRYIQNFSVTPPNASAGESAWTLSITASVSSRNKTEDETRQFKIVPRPRS